MANVANVNVTPTGPREWAVTVGLDIERPDIEAVRLTSWTDSKWSVTRDLPEYVNVPLERGLELTFTTKAPPLEAGQAKVEYDFAFAVSASKAQSRETFALSFDFDGKSLVYVPQAERERQQIVREDAQNTIVAWHGVALDNPSLTPDEQAVMDRKLAEARARARAKTGAARDGVAFVLPDAPRVDSPVSRQDLEPLDAPDVDVEPSTGCSSAGDASLVGLVIGLLAVALRRRALPHLALALTLFVGGRALAVERCVVGQISHFDSLSFDKLDGDPFVESGGEISGFRGKACTPSNTTCSPSSSACCFEYLPYMKVSLIRVSGGSGTIVDSDTADNGLALFALCDPSFSSSFTYQVLFEFTHSAAPARFELRSKTGTGPLGVLRNIGAMTSDPMGIGFTSMNGTATTGLSTSLAANWAMGFELFNRLSTLGETRFQRKLTSALTVFDRILVRVASDLGDGNTCDSDVTLQTESRRLWHELGHISHGRAVGCPYYPGLEGFSAGPELGHTTERSSMQEALAEWMFIIGVADPGVITTQNVFNHLIGTCDEPQVWCPMSCGTTPCVQQPPGVNSFGCTFTQSECLADCGPFCGGGCFPFTYDNDATQVVSVALGLWDLIDAGSDFEFGNVDDAAFDIADVYDALDTLKNTNGSPGQNATDDEFSKSVTGASCNFPRFPCSFTFRPCGLDNQCYSGKPHGGNVRDLIAHLSNPTLGENALASGVCMGNAAETTPWSGFRAQ